MSMMLGLELGTACSFRECQTMTMNALADGRLLLPTQVLILHLRALATVDTASQGRVGDRGR